MTDTTEINSAIDLLESHGFYVRGLWHADDVRVNYCDKLSDEACLAILGDVLGSDYLTQIINDQIANYGD